VQDEYSVDAFHRNGARLYGVYERQITDGKVDAGYYAPGPLGGELKKKIRSSVRVEFKARRHKHI
jgi:hypothetical protein